MRYVVELRQECGPGTVYWILDRETRRYTSHSLSQWAEAKHIADRLNQDSAA